MVKSKTLILVLVEVEIGHAKVCTRRPLQLLFLVLFSETLRPPPPWLFGLIPYDLFEVALNRVDGQKP